MARKRLKVRHGPRPWDNKTYTKKGPGQHCKAKQENPAGSKLQKMK